MVKPGRKTTGKGAESGSPVLSTRKSTRKTAAEKEAEVGDSLCVRCVSHVYIHGNLDKACDKTYDKQESKACSNCTRDHKGCQDIPEELEEDVARILRMHRDYRKTPIEVVQENLRIDMRSKANALNEQIEELKPEPEPAPVSEADHEMATVCSEVAASLQKTVQMIERNHELQKHTYNTLSVSCPNFPITTRIHHNNEC